MHYRHCPGKLTPHAEAVLLVILLPQEQIWLGLKNLYLLVFFFF